MLLYLILKPILRAFFGGSMYRIETFQVICINKFFYFLFFILFYFIFFNFVSCLPGFLIELELFLS